jgi:hypothetical protein
MRHDPSGHRAARRTAILGALGLAVALIAVGHHPAPAQAQELRGLPWSNRPPAPPPAPPPSPMPPAGQAPTGQTPGVSATGWKAVLVAGDDAQHVFTNAVETLRRQLMAFGVGAGDVAVLTADARDPRMVADRTNFDALSGRLTGPSGAGCFVFITSHGQRNEGLFLKRARMMLAPGHLDAVLDRGCGDRPTVVITSGCYSGIYADNRNMRRDHRIVLTAARADRTSFGCSNEYQFTFYDNCLLDSLRRGAAWVAIAHRVRACVERREEQVNALPSFPQTFFGARVSGLTAF